MQGQRGSDLCEGPGEGGRRGWMVGLAIVDIILGGDVSEVHQQVLGLTE